MKIRCGQSELLKGINISNKAIPTHTTMSILECLLIDATTNEIKLTGNDLEIGIETVIEGTIEERGMIALDAKVFADMIRSLPDNEVLIETDERMHTTIVCEKVRFDLAGKSGEDFPYIPVIPRNEPVELSQLSLKDVIRQTIFSTADNENNRMMTGELFEINGDKLRVASLDGYRISVRNITLKKNYEPKKVIVPAKSLNEISKIIGSSIEDDVHIYLSDNHIIFEFDRTTVVSRLIDGEFYRVDQMMNTDYETKLVVRRQDLLESIMRAHLLVNESDKKPIIMDIKDNLFNMRLNSVRGSFDEDVMASKEGRDLMIAFNPKFFIDVLRVVDDEQVSIYLVDPRSPGFIRDEKQTYNYLILPVNFNES